MATSSATFDVLSTSAAELQSLLAEGKVTGVQVVEAYLDQIEKHNHAGAKLRAIIATAERGVVLAKAAALDEERKNGHLRGPLHGIPIIVKDCFTYEPGMGLRTTVGSHAFAQEVGIRNAGVIQQLVDAGVIILATANLTEFCGHKCENMTPGWSAMGGQTQSAYDSERAPGAGLSAPCGGSSAGSAVGVSAGFAPISLGTQTGGSLIYPASKAGLYAMLPTLTTVAAQGAFRISRSFDGIGGIARNPADLATLIQAILLPEARKTLFESGRSSSMSGSWTGMKVGIVESTWGGGNPEKWASEPVKAKYEGVVEAMRNGGAHILYPAPAPKSDTLKTDGIGMKEVAFHEFNSVIREFCAAFENPKINNLDDIIQHNKDHADIAMPEPHRDQVELINSFNSPLTDEESDNAAEELKRLAGKDGMGRFMAENDLDLIVSSSDCSLVSFAACAGWPSGTVPLGQLENGLPYGLFILARAGEDERIFQFMSAFEKTAEKIALPVLRDF